MASRSSTELAESRKIKTFKGKTHNICEHPVHPVDLILEVTNGSRCLKLLSPIDNDVIG